MFCTGQLTTEGFFMENLLSCLSLPLLGPTSYPMTLYGSRNDFCSDDRYAFLLPFAKEKVWALKAMTSDPTPPTPKSKTLVKTKFEEHQVQYWHFTEKTRSFLTVLLYHCFPCT
ncbi:UNVERIFIED_CONTAM: hypothetical protein K2H54_000477 [Gekko kuhli]